MREWGNSTSPELPEPEEIIQGVSKELGLNPDAKPQWDYGPPVEQIFPEEAPSSFARRQAHHCLARLFYFLEWRLQGDKPKVNTQDLMYTYELVREEQVIDFDPDYELSHVLGAAKRHIAGLKELRQYEEINIYDKSIKVYSAIHDLIEQVVCPEGADAAILIKNIEQEIDQYLNKSAPHLQDRFHAYLNHTPVRLLPEEAENPVAREAASWCHEFLVEQVVGAREVDKHPTSDQIKEHYLWFLDMGQQGNEEWRRATFTLEQVFAETKRRLLYWHSIKDQRPDYYQSYLDTLTVYRLLHQALGVTLNRISSYDNQVGKDKNTEDGIGSDEPHGPDGMPF